MGGTGVFAGENPDAIWEKDSKLCYSTSKSPAPTVPSKITTDSTGLIAF